MLRPSQSRHAGWEGRRVDCFGVIHDMLSACHVINPLRSCENGSVPSQNRCSRKGHPFEIPVPSGVKWSKECIGTCTSSWINELHSDPQSRQSQVCLPPREHGPVDAVRCRKITSAFHCH